MAILCPASLGGNEVTSSDIPARTCQVYGLTDADIQSAKSCLLLRGAREQHRSHSLQGRFPCQNSEGPRAREKVVWKGPASKERSGLICRAADKVEKGECDVPTSQKYQQRATECLRLAKLANDPSNRRLLLELGQAWSRLAEQPSARAEDQNREYRRMNKGSNVIQITRQVLLH
jgi:hypothetical protein